MAAEKAGSKDPAQYCLPLDAMIEHEYPVPSYIADVFQKPAGEGWVETPERSEPHVVQGEEPPPPPKARVLAIDCEMVGSGLLVL
jgi:RNA exonuclease 1